MLQVDVSQMKIWYAQKLPAGTQSHERKGLAVQFARLDQSHLSRLCAMSCTTLHEN